MTFIYREHAIQRMFERDIFEIDVEDTVKDGEIIEEYLDDKPYPLHYDLATLIHTKNASSSLIK